MLNKVKVIHMAGKDESRDKVFDTLEEAEIYLEHNICKSCSQDIDEYGPLSTPCGGEWDIVPFREGFVEIVEPAHSC